MLASGPIYLFCIAYRHDSNLRSPYLNPPFLRVTEHYGPGQLGSDVGVDIDGDQNSACDGKIARTALVADPNRLIHRLSVTVGVVDLMLKRPNIGIDFADVRSVLAKMGKMAFGRGQASGENRAIR